MSELPSRKRTSVRLQRWGNSKEAFGFYNDFADIIEAYVSGRLVDREARAADDTGPGRAVMDAVIGGTE